MPEQMVEQSGVLQHIGEMLDRKHVAALAFLTTVSLGGGMLIRSSLGTETAQAQTPSGRPPKQIQEYLQVSASADGTALPFQGDTFEFTEHCKDDSKPVSRTVKYTKPEQPLGRCDAGSPVTVTEQPPLQGDWVHKSGIKQGPITATIKNNHHFKFVEQKADSPSGSQPVETPVQPAPTPAPTEPTPPSGGGGTTPTPEIPPYTPGNEGADVSWAQCDGPDNADTTIGGSLSGLDFVIVDLEGGLGFTPNPCLKSEVADITAAGIHMDFYINTGWYSGSSHASSTSPNVCATGDEVCIANNYGSANASFAIQTASSEGISISGKRVFRDGETSNTWAAEANGQANAEDAQENEASLQGSKDTLIASGASDSLLYENQDFENVVLDGLQTDEPTWLAAGADSAVQAEASCGTVAPDGGAVELSQFNGETASGIALDEDLVCP